MHHYNHTTHHVSVIAAALSRLSSSRRLVPALLFALLSTLSTSAFAAPQFTTLTIGGTTYPDATKDLSGNGWTWTASTNTLEFSDLGGTYNYLDHLINGNIAFGTSNPAAVATIEASNEIYINGNISSQGALLVNTYGYTFRVNGTLAGSLSVTGYSTVTVGNDITGNLSSDGATVKVGGKVGGDLTVSSGAVTINGTVGGARDITGGTVKVNGSFISGAPPAITTNVTIPLNTLTLTPSGSASGPGWSFSSWFDDNSNSLCGYLDIQGSGINYTLTGAAPTGIQVFVEDTVNGSLTLDGVTIDTGDNYAYYAALQIDEDNPITVYISRS